MISPLAYVDPEAKLGKNVTVLPCLLYTSPSPRD